MQQKYVVQTLQTEEKYWQLSQLNAHTYVHFYTKVKVSQKKNVWSFSMNVKGTKRF